MKNWKTLFTTLAATSLSLAASADLVAHWNFNELSIATASNPGSGGVPTSISSDSGSATLSLANWTGLVDDFAGDAANAVGADPAEESLSLVGNTGNGSFIEISFNMSGFSGLEVSFGVRGTGTGFNSGQWSYSTNGSTFTDFGGNTSSNSSSWTVPTVTTSGLDNAATAFLRYTLNGATSTSGNNRLDNLQLNATPGAVPEPTSAILLGLGGLILARFRRKG